MGLWTIRRSLVAHKEVSAAIQVQTQQHMHETKRSQAKQLPMTDEPDATFFERLSRTQQAHAFLHGGGMELQSFFEGGVDFR